MSVFLTLLLGCVPVGMMRPVSPMGEGHREEIGVSAVGAQPPQGEYFPTGRFQIWVARQYSPKFDLAVFAFGGSHANRRTRNPEEVPSMVVDLGGGVDIRRFFYTDERVRFGGGLRTGWQWIDVSLPFAVRLAGNLWLETRPAFGFPLVAQVPLAVSIPLGRDWLLMPEFGYYYQGNVNSSTTEVFQGGIYTVDARDRHHRLYGSLGVVWRYR